MFRTRLAHCNAHCNAVKSGEINTVVDINISENFRLRSIPIYELAKKQLNLKLF